MVGRPLFIARGQAPPLLEPVYQSLHRVPGAVDRPVERPRAPLVSLARDRNADAPPPQVRPDLPAAVALGADDPLGAQPGTAPAWAFHRALFHELLKGGRCMTLAGRQPEGDGLAGARAADMDLGAEPALAPPEGFRRWVPFFAPAACWWARMTVAAT